MAYLTRNDYPEGMLQISIRYPAGLPMYGVNYSSLVSALRQWQIRRSVPALRGQSYLRTRRICHPWSFNIAEQRGALAVLDRIASNLELAPSATDH